MGLPKLWFIMIAISVWGTLGVPPERDGNHDKPEFGQPHEEILMLIIWN